MTFRRAASLYVALLGFSPMIASGQPGDFDLAWSGGECRSTSTGDAMVALLVADGSRSYLVGQDGAGSYVVRCDATGNVDPTFAGGRTPITVPAPFVFSARTATLGDDGRLIAVGNVTRTDTQAAGLGLVRVNLDGTMDTGYGLHQGRYVDYEAAPNIAAAAKQAGGRIVVAGDDGRSSVSPADVHPRPFIARFTTEGAPDPTFDPAGIQTQFKTVGSITSLVQQPDGNWLAGGWGYFPAGTSSVNRASVTRLTVDGAPDPTFGHHGTTIIDAWPFGAGTFYARVVPLADGRVIVAGTYSGAAGGGMQGVFVARLASSGVLDLSFGQGGWTTTSVAGAARAETVVQADGSSIVIVSSIGSYSQLIRYTPDGLLDTGFGLGGRVALTSTGVPAFAALQGGDKLLVLYPRLKLGYGTARLLLDGTPTLTTLASDVSIAPLGQAVVLIARVSPPGSGGSFVRFDDENGPLEGCGAVALVEGVATCGYRPAESGQHTLRATYVESGVNRPATSASADIVQVATPTGTLAAVEFYHGRYGHYFLTANASEASGLDANAAAGWRRTGMVFPVWPLGATGTSEVCRFWTGSAFAPVSSHFYTPYPSECADVLRNKDWIFEGTPFAVRLTASDGDCAGGTTRLYRYYNNGQGGAPNHRYVTSRAMRPDMIGRGWIAEGTGSDVVFACLPAT